MIRTVCLEDAQAVFALEREVIEEGAFFIAVEDEYDNTLEQQQDSTRDDAAMWRG